MDKRFPKLFLILYVLHQFHYNSNNTFPYLSLSFSFFLQLTYSSLFIVCQNFCGPHQQKCPQYFPFLFSLIFISNFLLVFWNYLIIYNLTKMSGENLNLNLSKNYQPKQILTTCYACECGKRYDNFPALYLHFQRKHDQRISTKIDQEYCRVQEKPMQRVITYFILEKQVVTTNSKKNIIPQNSMLEVRSVLRKFKVSFEKEVHQSNMEVMKQILSLFENYMEKNFNERNFEGSINEIPMYFNDFILKSLGNTIENTKYLYVCELLSKLAFWLKQSSLTELQVEYVGFNPQTYIKN